MANIYAGGLGDAVKQLLYAEALALERPDEVWESHAGAPRYELDENDAAVRFGVGHLRQVAPPDPLLSTSAWWRSCTPGPHRGSIELAHAVLPGLTRVVACERNRASVAALVEVAKGWPALEPAHTDGLARLLDELGARGDRRALAFLDPFLSFREETSAHTPLDVFEALARAGVPALLFFAFNSFPRRDLALRLLGERGVDELWVGHVELEHDPPTRDWPGVRGGGLAAVGLAASTTSRMEALGRALATA